MGGKMKFPKPPLKIDEPLSVAKPFTVRAYAATSKYSLKPTLSMMSPKFKNTFGQVYIPISIKVPRLNVS